VFVPLAAISLAARGGAVTLASGFQWMASDAALLAFSIATVCEIAAYYLPWFDHLLDVVASPTAVVAGIVATASVFVDVPPLVRWTVAVVGGGAIAGVVQGATLSLRLKSTAFTGGLGNPVVATGEAAGAAAASAVALLLPLVALALVAVAVAVAWRLLRATRRVISGRTRRIPPGRR
jgi:hypothetical protein